MIVPAYLTRSRIAHHAATVALAATTIDAAYTTAYWLILGRPHPARWYVLVVAQLSAEAALIAHLVGIVRRGA
jgi:hypothetical protein